jgi:hypothetical protein
MIRRASRLMRPRVVAVDGFAVGTYTFSCARDCAGATCAIAKPTSSLGGTLPDAFDRLACKAKITYMCAPGTLQHSIAAGGPHRRVLRVGRPGRALRGLTVTHRARCAQIAIVQCHRWHDACVALGADRPHWTVRLAAPQLRLHRSCHTSICGRHPGCHRTAPCAIRLSTIAAEAPAAEHCVRAARGRGVLQAVVVQFHRRHDARVAVGADGPRRLVRPATTQPALHRSCPTQTRLACLLRPSIHAVCTCALVPSLRKHRRWSPNVRAGPRLAPIIALRVPIIALRVTNNRTKGTDNPTKGTDRVAMHARDVPQGGIVQCHRRDDACVALGADGPHLAVRPPAARVAPIVSASHGDDLSSYLLPSIRLVRTALRSTPRVPLEYPVSTP